QLNASRLLSPRGTGERAGELSHAALIELARRSLRARARAPSSHAQRAKRPEFRGETAKPPRIAPWGLLLTDPRRRFATREKWLRVRRGPLPRSQGSPRDWFAPLALSQNRVRTANPSAWLGRAGTLSVTRTVPRRMRGHSSHAQCVQAPVVSAGGVGAAISAGTVDAVVGFAV